MKNILIIFGGRSAEHEISILSARNIINALDRGQYNPILVAISRSGNWHLLSGDSLPTDLKFVDDNIANTNLCSLIRKSSGPFLLTESGKSINLDIAFPVLHGPMGEDGTIQGMFEMVMLPYVGAGVMASSLCMDKDAYKRFLISEDLPIVPFVTLKKNEIILSYEEVCQGLETDAFFVKAASLGSSVGIYKVSTEAQYLDALENAFEYSYKVVIEKAILNCREIQCAIIGNADPESAGLVEIKTHHEFHSYEAKYYDDNGAEYIIPATDLTPDQEEMLRELSLRSYLAVDCRGMARIDFLISEDGDIYISELNTIPGFTSSSPYPKICEEYGISYPELITQLINLAMEEFHMKQSFKLMPEYDHEKVT